MVIKMEKERVQKIMAHAGYCSRRKAEELINQGKVKVNGQVISLGATADSSDRIEVDNKPLSSKETTVTYLFNKPLGVLSTVQDDRGRKVITDYFASLPYRLYPVGRLDINTSGAILVSNDGELANLVTHPSTHLDKTYLVTIDSTFKDEDKIKLEKGIMLEDGMTAPAKVEVINDLYKQSIKITIHEGRNRQVRRMFDALGYHVKTLTRESVGFLKVDKLHTGEYRALTSFEITTLKNLCLQRKKTNQIPDYKKK